MRRQLRTKHMPRWLRHMLHRPDPPADTPERAHEARKPQEMPTVGQNADRAIAGNARLWFVREFCRLVDLVADGG